MKSTEKRKSVSFAIKRVGSNRGLSKKGRALKERLSKESDNRWYSPNELKAFKSQTILEVINFQQEINACNLKVVSPFDAWKDSQLDIKTTLLSELDKNNLPSTSSGLESCIFHQHRLNKNLAIRETLKYHKKSEALIRSSKIQNSESKKRFRKIAAHQLALLSSKYTTWAKEAALKEATLICDSIEAYQYDDNSFRKKNQNIKIDQVTESLKRKKFERRTKSSEGKRLRRNAISLVNLNHFSC